MNTEIAEKAGQESEDLGENEESQIKKGSSVGNVPLVGGFRKPLMRFPLLMLLSSIIIISSMNYDSPSPMKHYFIKNQSFKISNFKFNLLYSVVGGINCIFTYFSGTIIDVFGDTTGFIPGSVLVTCGQALFYVGINNETFIIMIIGRVILGMGYDLCVESMNACCSTWFKPFELSFAFGSSMCANLCGQLLGQALLPSIYLSGNQVLSYPFMFLMSLSFFSIIAALTLWLIDSRYVVRNFDNIPLSTLNPNFKESIKDHFRHMKEIDYPFLIFALSGAFFTGAFYVYGTNVNELLVRVYNITPESAGLFVIYSIGSNIIAAPLVGLLIDRSRAYSSFYIILSYGLFSCGLFFLINFQNYSVYSALFPLMLLGSSNALFRDAFYSRSSIIIKFLHVQRANIGLKSSSQNLLFSIFNLIYGATREYIDEENIELFANYYIMIFPVFVALVFLLLSWSLGNEHRVIPETISEIGDVDLSFEDLDYEAYRTLRNSAIPPSRKMSSQGVVRDHSQFFVSKDSQTSREEKSGKGSKGKSDIWFKQKRKEELIENGLRKISFL